MQYVIGLPELYKINLAVTKKGVSLYSKSKQNEKNIIIINNYQFFFSGM